MKLIKLSAIGSTNAYLKELCQQEKQQSYTVVQTHEQSQGRGQLGTTWVSDKGKNLTFSVLVNFLKFEVGDQFFISMAVSLAIQKVLNAYVDNDIRVKWPNDILADGQKIAGILIENNLSGGHLSRVVIGIGLNVNQESFPNEIPNATSLKLLTNKSFELETVLDEIITSIEYYMAIVLHGGFDFLTKLYYGKLFRFGECTCFTDASGLSFSGKIIGVTHAGMLRVEVGDKKTREFNLKEIKFSSF
ncbi:MAG: biotin--[acetyl-CoA-carboxylase] ligase [Flavobacteriaceae bacterium]|nr:MAG: biotin--[acetyl-CoA-carboxylase] ligase [Flavobacteriaceae bacterium]